MIRILSILLSCFLLLSTVIGIKYMIQQYQITHYSSALVEHILDLLDPEERLGQMFFVYSSLLDNNSFVHLQPGGIFLQSSSIPLKANGRQNLLLLKQRIKTVQNKFIYYGLPTLFIGVDQEFGKVQRLKDGVWDFTSAMGLGNAVASTRDFHLAKQSGYYMCRDLKALGITFSFSPVVDLQTHRENTVIGTRAFGSDPQLVTGVADNYITGMHSAYCVSTLKHYPGHGATHTDSHIAVPIQNKNMDTLLHTDLLPFFELIGSNSLG